MKKLTAILMLLTVSSLFARFPTHPNQVGLAGAGIDRDTLPVSSQIKFTSADNGKVISGVKFEGTVKLDATDGITFRRCWFAGGTYYSIQSGNTGAPVNTTLEDCDFGSHGEASWVSNSHFYSLQGTNYIRRCFLYNSGDGIKWSGNSVNYIDSCWIQPVFVPDKHTDCMQFNDQVQAKVYAANCVFERRTWVFNDNIAFAQEELAASGITTANIRSWGNAALQTKIDAPTAATFISFKECITTGGNYIVTASGADGEFMNNAVVRGSGNPGTDLGLRDAYNFAVSGNYFHDDGAEYTGGKLGSGETAVPIPDLVIYGVNGIEDAVLSGMDTRGIFQLLYDLSGRPAVPAGRPGVYLLFDTVTGKMQKRMMLR